MRFLPLVLAFAACASTARATPPPQTPFPQVGAQMPRFIADRWVNSPPLQPESLRGKVVLVDFWEYTCVNCIRTLPYVKAWYARYAAAGLVVVGVHAPEFEFGKRAENIDRGIRDHGLTYPIAIDNDFSTWVSYRNRAWPAKYLFDAQGRLRNVWIGEGGYPEIEDKIRQLLVEAGARSLPPPTAEVQAYRDDAGAGERISPETYLGTARREGHSVARVGAWDSKEQYIEHAGDDPAKIVLDFVGGEVNLVLEPGRTGKARVHLALDDRDLGDVVVDHAGMYRLVHGAGPGKHRLDVETEDDGLRAYAFTFGP